MNKDNVYLYFPQDESVGLASFGINIELPGTGELIDDGEEELLEFIRANLEKCFGEIYDDCPQVSFYNELPL